MLGLAYQGFTDRLASNAPFDEVINRALTMGRIYKLRTIADNFKRSEKTIEKTTRVRLFGGGLTR